MSGADTSRWTSQLVIKVAIAAAAVGCLGPLAFALVRSGTEQTRPSRKVATVGQVSLNSSPAASSALPPSAPPAARPAAVEATIPGVVTTSTTLAVSTATTTSTTIPGASSASQVAVVTVVDADDGKVIMLRRGQRLRVVLQGPTWQFAEPSDHEVLTPQGSPTYTPGDNCTPLPGTHCGTVTAEFKAMKTGASVVSATRAPCVQCADDHPQYRLEVRVRS
jgi:hypothetical protein